MKETIETIYNIDFDCLKHDDPIDFVIKISLFRDKKITLRSQNDDIMKSEQFLKKICEAPGINIKELNKSPSSKICSKFMREQLIEDLRIEKRKD